MSWTSLFIEKSLSYCLTSWQVCDTTRLLIWRLSVCTLPFDGLKSPLLKKCFSDLNLYEEVKSSGLVVQLKLKCWLMKRTHDGIVEAKEVYTRLSFERYKGKLVLRNLSPSVYNELYIRYHQHPFSSIKRVIIGTISIISKYTWWLKNAKTNSVCQIAHLKFLILLRLLFTLLSLLSSQLILLN